MRYQKWLWDKPQQCRDAQVCGDDSLFFRSPLPKSSHIYWTSKSYKVQGLVANGCVLGWRWHTGSTHGVCAISSQSVKMFTRVSCQMGWCLPWFMAVWVTCVWPDTGWLRPTDGCKGHLCMARHWLTTSRRWLFSKAAATLSLSASCLLTAKQTRWLHYI